MVNNFSNKTYLFVSKKKFIIVVYNNENKVVYKNEKLKSEKTDKLDFKFLKEFLNRNSIDLIQLKASYMVGLGILLDWVMEQFLLL